MRRTRTGWVVLGAAAAFVTAGNSTEGRGQDAPKAGTGKSGLTEVYFGKDSCKDCHTAGNQNKLCRCTESAEWDKIDKHQVAYNVLLDDRSRRMGELLGYKPHQRKECLACHAVYIDPKQVKDGSVEIDPTFLKAGVQFSPEKFTLDQLRLEEGVNCAVCHGPYDEWYYPHANLRRPPRGSKRQTNVNWREIPPEVKERDFGMTNLWDADRRSKLCASCHVGNAAEGKVVTHEMYAAGHPPLPSFEIASFGLNEAPHWEFLREKAQRNPELFQSESAKPDAPKLVRYDRNRLEIASLVTVGSAAAYREAAKLLGDEAAKCAAAPNANEKVLNLAQFDCAACHHDLQIPSWRQQRGYGGGKPGRPVARIWPTALVDLGIYHAGQSDSERAALHKEFDAHHRRLRDALDARPFGEAPRVRDAAKDLVTWSQRLTERLNDPKTHYTKQDAANLLKHLAAMPAAGTPDFDSARQVAWAFTAIYGELQAELADSNAAEDRALKEAYAKIGGSMKPHLDTLNANLRLKFHRNDGPDPKPVPKEQLKVESFFPKVLERMSEYLVRKPAETPDPKVYGPADFQATFAAIRKLLP